MCGPALSPQDLSDFGGGRFDQAEIGEEGATLSGGQRRVIADCRFAVQLNRFIPGFLS
jgi:hypothetical protein